MECLFVDVDDDALAGITRPSSSQDDDRIEDLNGPDHENDQDKEDRRGQKWKGYPEKQLHRVGAIQTSGIAALVLANC